MTVGCDEIPALAAIAGFPNNCRPPHKILPPSRCGLANVAQDLFQVRAGDDGSLCRSFVERIADFAARAHARQTVAEPRINALPRTRMRDPHRQISP